jgi:hypothetical protein
MILQAFEDIPWTFMRAVQASMRFPDDADLRHAVTQLYITLLKQVPVLIQTLRRSHPQKNLGEQVFNVLCQSRCSNLQAYSQCRAS